MAIAIRIRNILFCVLTTHLGACAGGGAESGDAPRLLEMEVTAMQAGLELHEAAAFELDPEGMGAALQEIARVDDELALLEDPFAAEAVLVRITLDGEPLLERRMPLGSAVAGLTALDTLAGSLEAAPMPHLSSPSGVTVVTQAAKCGFVCTVCRWTRCGGEYPSAIATIGVRG